MTLRHWKGDVDNTPSFFDRLMGWDEEEPAWMEDPTSAGISQFIKSIWQGSLREVPRVVEPTESFPEDDLLVTRPQVTNEDGGPVTTRVTGDSKPAAAPPAAVAPPPDYSYLYRGLSNPQMLSMMRRFGGREPGDPSRQHLEAAIKQYNIENPDRPISPMQVDTRVTRYTPTGQPRRTPTIAEVSKIRDPARRRAFFEIISNPALAARLYAPDIKTVDPNADNAAVDEARSLIQLLQQKLKNREKQA